MRERVARSTSELEAVQSLLNAILACKDAVLPHIPNMVTAIINGMYSHLSSKYCKEMWEGLCRAALPDKRIGLISFENDASGFNIIDFFPKLFFCVGSV